MLPSSAHISVRGEGSDARLEWDRFDGDDCFEDFRIVVRRLEEVRQFDFGACAVSGLRRMVRFFSDPQKSTEGGGFRNPDVRYFDWTREEDGLRVVIQFEGSSLKEEFLFRKPAIEIDRSFIDSYDSEA